MLPMSRDEPGRVISVKKRRIIHARQAIIVEVVSSGYDEVNVELLPDSAHLCGKKMLIMHSSTSMYRSDFKLLSLG
jgi:hypothetical protein